MSCRKVAQSSECPVPSLDCGVLDAPLSPVRRTKLKPAIVRYLLRPQRRIGVEREESGKLGADVARAIMWWHVQMAIGRQDTEVAAATHPMVCSHLARGRIKELDAGPTGNYLVANDLHLMAAMMLKAESVLSRDTFIDGPGQRIVGVEIEIIVKRTPQIHVRVRSPQTSLKPKQIDGYRIVRRRVVRSPKLTSVSRRDDIQLSSPRKCNHIPVDDQGGGKLGRQHDR